MIAFAHDEAWFMDTADGLLSFEPVQLSPNMLFWHHLSRDVYVCQALHNCHNVMTIQSLHHQSDIGIPDDVQRLFKKMQEIPIQESVQVFVLIQ